MRARQLLSLTLLFAGLALSKAAWAYPEYRVTIVGPPDSVAVDINNDGAVVGTFPISATATHAFLNRGSGVIDIGALRGTSSNAMAINNKGQVVGNWTNRYGQSRGYIYSRGVFTDIGVVPGYGGRFTDINDYGYITVIGQKIDTFEGTRSFLRAPGGTYRNIGYLPAANPLTDARALNNSNMITGDSSELTFPEQPLRAILWSKGVMRDIGSFGYTPNAGFDINDCGQITGYAAVLGPLHDRVAFLYSNGRMIDIDRRPEGGSRFSEGQGINNHGHVVGFSDHLGGFVYRGRKMESLNALIDPALGWNIQFPRAINDKGQIAATGYRAGKQYAVRLDLIRPHLLQAPAPLHPQAVDPE